MRRSAAPADLPEAERPDPLLHGLVAALRRGWLRPAMREVAAGDAVEFGGTRDVDRGFGALVGARQERAHQRPRGAEQAAGVPGEAGVDHARMQGVDGDAAAAEAPGQGVSEQDVAELRL